MRYALGIEYDGSEFLGWQIQRQAPTVQGVLESALARVADHEARVTACGRTDTGVHAVCQVAHFDSASQRAERSWILGLNSHLPRAASVVWIRSVSDDFHARFSAFARSYRYRIANRWIRPALEARYVSWYRRPLDAGRMHEDAQCLLGEHDFSSFRALACQARSPVRTLYRLDIKRSGAYLYVDVEANAFLHHMVRNIAGVLIAVGRGVHHSHWVQDILDRRDRTQGGVTAPANGLYLVGVRYPQKYGIGSLGVVPEFG